MTCLVSIVPHALGSQYIVPQIGAEKKMTSMTILGKVLFLLFLVFLFWVKFLFLGFCGGPSPSPDAVVSRLWIRPTSSSCGS